MAGAIENSIIEPAELENKKSAPTPLSGGFFEVEVTRDGDKIIINSVGTVDNFSRSLKLELSRIRGSFPLFDHALFATGIIKMDGSPYIKGDFGTNQSSAGSIDFAGGNPRFEGDIYRA